jgi:hypothetical protein
MAETFVRVHLRMDWRSLRVAAGLPQAGESQKVLRAAARQRGKGRRTNFFLRRRRTCAPFQRCALGKHLGIDKKIAA